MQQIFEQRPEWERSVRSAPSRCGLSFFAVRGEADVFIRKNICIRCSRSAIARRAAPTEDSKRLCAIISIPPPPRLVSFRFVPFRSVQQNKSPTSASACSSFSVLQLSCRPLSSRPVRPRRRRLPRRVSSASELQLRILFSDNSRGSEREGEE